VAINSPCSVDRLDETGVVGPHRSRSGFERDNQMRWSAVALQLLRRFIETARSIFDVQHRPLDLAEMSFIAALLGSGHLDPL